MADTPPTHGAGAGKDLPIDQLLAEQDRSQARDKPPTRTRTAKKEENRAKAAEERAIGAQLAGDNAAALKARTSGNSNRAKRERRLLEQLGAVGTTVTMFDEVCGPSILAGAPRLASALARLADENPSIARALDASLTGSAWFELTIAVGAIALPICAHHGLLPGAGSLTGLGAALVHDHQAEGAEVNGAGGL